jgi:hypothetical protein
MPRQSSDTGTMIKNRLTIAGALCALLVLAGCGYLTGTGEEMAYPSDRQEREDRERFGTITGEDGFQVFATGRRGRDAGDGGELGVNTWLWRATLETVDFMPLASADPFGGVIITDWYAPPETPDERFKVTVLIRDRALRADGVRVSVFRQVRDQNGAWSDAPVDGRTATSLEDTILTRARQLRVASVG